MEEIVKKNQGSSKSHEEFEKLLAQDMGSRKFKEGEITTGIVSKVGKKFIGPGEPTYIIAEIGINHEGDPDVCLKMIKEAAAAGADAIKLQTYTPDSMTINCDNEDFIVDNGLCIGCGLCQSITGKDSIEILMSSKGRLEPKEISQISPEIFDKILKVCPGVIVEGLPKEQVDTNTSHNLVWGYYLSLCYAWSTDNKIRFESSTGGLLNGLSLYLLDSKKIDFVLHTVTDPKKPMRSISKLSYNKEELLNYNSCSRYGPASPLDRFHEALNLNQPFVFVGKPCDISAIRQLSKTDNRVNLLCKYLLTLVCGGFAEFTKAQDFIESIKVKEDELSIFRYRGSVSYTHLTLPTNREV